MKRKFCTILGVLAISAALTASASAAQWRQTCILPDKPPAVCWRLGASGACPEFTWPDSDCTQTPAVPETPDPSETPDAPSAPETPSAPEQSAVLAQERAVLELVNEIRAQNGLSALTLDADLCRYARVKSQDMHDAGYFSHTSPTYGSPFAMMRQFGISYNYAGENIAQGYATAEAVVNAWMNSEGHRANILNANYTRLGVGFVAAGNYWTQWFLG